MLSLKHPFVNADPTDFSAYFTRQTERVKLRNLPYIKNPLFSKQQGSQSSATYTRKYVGLISLQNNKALKRSGNALPSDCCLISLQNNKALKHNSFGYWRNTCLISLQNNKALKLLLDIYPAE